MTKLYLTEYAYKKLKYYVGQCEEEISGLGKVFLKRDEIGDPYFVVTDVEIFKQKVGPAHATMDEDTLAKFIFEKQKVGESLVDWRFWWHSHAKMKAFFSGTDTNTIDTSTEYPWLVSLVTNHEGELKARIDVYEPVRYDEDLKVEIIEQEDADLKAKCLKEIEEKVEKIAGYQYHHHREKGTGFQSLQAGEEMDEDDYLSEPWKDPKMMWDYKQKKYVLKPEFRTSGKEKSSTHETTKKK